MSYPQSPSWTCVGEHCITCGDDGVPMTVVRIDARRSLALCADAGGTRHTVESALVEPLAAGRMVLVHAGVAIASLSSEGNPPAGAATVQRSAEGATCANMGHRESGNMGRRESGNMGRRKSGNMGHRESGNMGRRKSGTV